MSLLHESLYFTEGSSDKQYDLMIDQLGDTFTASARWGRRGNLGDPQVIYSGPDRAQAEKAVQKKRAAKVAKGYTPGVTGTPFSGAVEAGEHSGLSPMLLTAISVAAAPRFIASATYWLQAKFDGIRQLIEIGSDGVRGINRRGLYMGLPADIAEALAGLPGSDHVIDGELVSGHFHAFDLVRMDGRELVSVPYRERVERLRKLLDGAAPCVSVARTETTPEAKAAYFEELQNANAEGAVFKDSGSGLALGARSSSNLKCKFWASATCQVASINEQRSVGLRMVQGSTFVDVGNCTVPLNCDIPSVGEFVEIKYLYAYRGGSLYQPQYLGVRRDVTISDCQIDQLKYKADSQAA